MQVLQREARRVVTPRGSPICCGVAARTLRGWEVRRHVIWNRAAHGSCSVVLVLMATVAIRVCRREVVGVIHMACGTARCRVHTRQRPARRSVIEVRRRPGNRVVTGRAVGRRERPARI